MDDYYIIHINKEKVLKEELNKESINIVQSGSFLFNEKYVLNGYDIFYQDKVISYLEMKTFNNTNKTIILKNSIEYDISTNELMLKFTELFQKFTKNLLEKYEIINNSFYILEKTYYLDTIYLKKTFHAPNLYVSISINIDRTYDLYIDSSNKYSFDNIDELIVSSHINKLKKDILHSSLQFLRIF